jgi:hypothetical protein
MTEALLTLATGILLVVIYFILDSNNKLRKELNSKNKFISDQDEQLKTKISKLVESGAFDSILNVDRFNDWFNSPNSKKFYVNPGIFLRLDKLSSGNISDYIKDELHGLVVYDNFPFSKVTKFEDNIRKDWLKKLQSKASL